MRLLRPELLLLGVATLIGVAGAEGGLRAFVALSESAVAREVTQADPFAIKVRPTGDFGYRQKPNTVFTYDNGAVATSNELGYRGPAVGAQKPKGTERIVLLGGSSTHGWGVVDDSTLDGFMRSELARRIPQRHFEVINLAFDGYDSQQFLQRLLIDGIPLQPDIVIVNAGANDVRNSRYADLVPRDGRTLLWEAPISRLREEERNGGPSLGTRVKHTIYLARLPGILRMHVQARQSSAVEGPVVPNLEAADYFEDNIEKIVQHAVAEGACVLLSTEPSALKWLDPDTVSARSYWVGTAAQTQMVRDTLSARMQGVADRNASAGQPVWHIRPELPQSGFMDDSHLLGSGYRELAHHLVQELMPVLEGSGDAEAPPGRRMCAAKVYGRRGVIAATPARAP